jgi:type VI protein secretion system component VasF
MTDRAQPLGRNEKMRMRARLAQVVQELMDERPNLSHDSEHFKQEVQRRYEQRHGALSPMMVTLLLAALKILLLAL